MVASPVPPLDFKALKALSFDIPDEETFRCLSLAKKVAKMPSGAAAAMNGANEAAVELLGKKYPAGPRAIVNKYMSEISGVRLGN